MYSPPKGAFDPVIQDPSEGYRRPERVVAAYTPFVPPLSSNIPPVQNSTIFDPLVFEPTPRSSPRPLYLPRLLPIPPSSLILPLEPSEVLSSPLRAHSYLLALHSSGHLNPLETSRKVLQQRYQRGLEKMNFEQHWIGFLHTLGREGLGGEGWKVRFLGELEGEIHSPYIHSYLPLAPTPSPPLLPFSSPLVIRPPRIQKSTWTHLRTCFREGREENVWACKVRGLWPVRIVISGVGGGVGESRKEEEGEVGGEEGEGEGLSRTEFNTLRNSKFVREVGTLIKKLPVEGSSSTGS